MVGFSPAEQFDLFRIVAAVLHIGNITIMSTRADDAVMPDLSQAERVCHLLGILMLDFTWAVLRPRVLAARFEQGFIVQHYAGKVEYHTEGWLEKNKDLLNDNLTRVLAESSE